MTDIIWNAGFERIQFSTERYDTYADAPQASSAAAFDTRGVNVLAYKPVAARDESRPARRPEPVAEAGEPVSAGDIPASADEVYDAGHLGCGDGPLLTIAQRLKAMAPGAVLEVRSTDAGVVADLPAWCRMVGHAYLGGGDGNDHGRYFIRRKDG
ncbi:MAG TPA: sulfurtransferase TusA family protein [Thermomicrobiales bacterium]|nr:sulfurtransferase TusA family protein [Thermomicrobiales bacterium]